MLMKFETTYLRRPICALFGMTAVVAGCSDRQSMPVPSVSDSSVDSSPKHGVIQAAYIPPKARSGPLAKPAEKSFDFGTVEPLRTHRHTFEVRNEGTEPLELFAPSATCKCLEVESVTDVVPPGETGEIVVAWTAKATQDAFLQRASVKTNDPEREALEFKVFGQALLLLATDPPELVAPRVKPEESAAIDGTIFSHVLEDFTVDHVQASLDGMTWKITPAPQEHLDRVGAKSGWHIQVTVPDDLPEGGFIQWLRFTVEPKNRPADAPEIEPELLTHEVTVQGKVLRRLSVFGDGIDYDGTFDAGIVSSATGAEKILTVRVQDREKELNVVDVTTDPSFVEAHFEPIPGGKKPGLYRLTLRIPPGAEPGYYRRENMGKVTLKFDHPRIDSLELGLLLVVPNDRSSRTHQLSDAGRGP